MAIDVTGRTFGRLTAVAREDGSRWRFKRACGAEKVLEPGCCDTSMIFKSA
jgi:hypothetical protein